MSSLLDPTYQQEIDALIKDLTINKPQDVVKYCADYFNRRLATDKPTQLSGASAGQNMADTEGPGPFERNRASNTIQEEDEERDSFGSPTQSKSSPFSGFGGFGGGGAATGGSGGSLFGNWMGGQGATDDADAAQHTPANFPGAGRRTSVSAEAMQPDADSGSWKPPKHDKTTDQLDRLRAAVSNNFLFANLDPDNFRLVLDALSEKAIPAANIRVINQGDEGDYFYVVESGKFDVYIHGSGAPSGADMGNNVATIGPGGSECSIRIFTLQANHDIGFGELALMYNAPRAATIVSTERGMLWQLDRITFRKILMTSASERRKLYEGFLEDVPLLEGLKPYERAKIADALETIIVPAGHNIITEGEPGHNFYMLEQGEAAAYRSGVDHAVKEYTRGDFFGELALLHDKPRAASVVAKTECKIAKLGRDGFKRLLGPLEGIMRNVEYEGELDPLEQTNTAT